MKNIVAVIVVLLMVGCTSIKRDFIFDGSSEMSTKAGIAKVMKRLKPKDRIEFSMALLAIQFSDVSSVYDVIDDPTMMSEINYFIIGKKIDGLNYKQVLDLASSSKTKVSISME